MFSIYRKRQRSHPCRAEPCALFKLPISRPANEKRGCAPLERPRFGRDAMEARQIREPVAMNAGADAAMA